MKIREVAVTSPDCNASISKGIATASGPSLEIKALAVSGSYEKLMALIMNPAMT
ncbi:hypothetical protein [Metallosphaera hakonensis]|uniref:hypothetical protein n=1 Tax=Metallosphaera hakonensis TaxID=79601 RepID=UPI000B0989A0|nr:hypothetical protein [Metallosphaera hakonensis]